jgi:hypothetical protein
MARNHMKNLETLDVATLRWAVAYLRSWRDAKASYPGRVPAFVSGCDEMLVHLEAATERVANGERAEPVTPVGCVKHLETLTLERIVEPSRIRRGRIATSPKWFVTFAESGKQWRFQTRKAAQVFIAAGGCTHKNAFGGMQRPWCGDCNGYEVRA